MPRKSRHSANCLTLSPVDPIPRPSRIPSGEGEEKQLLKRKENSSRDLQQRLEVQLRHRTLTPAEEGGEKKKSKTKFFFPPVPQQDSISPKKFPWLRNINLIPFR